MGASIKAVLRSCRGGMQYCRKPVVGSSPRETPPRDFRAKEKTGRKRAQRRSLGIVCPGKE